MKDEKIKIGNVYIFRNQTSLATITMNNREYDGWSNLINDKSEYRAIFLPTNFESKGIINREEIKNLEIELNKTNINGTPKDINYFINSDMFVKEYSAYMGKSINRQ